MNVHLRPPITPGELSVYGSINASPIVSGCTIVFYQSCSEKRESKQLETDNIKEVDKVALRRWRKRGFYSENVLVKLLHKRGCRAVRVPVSNPSLSPLPDIIARKDTEIYAFEVKNASYYAYFPRQQVDKLFRFLNELIPVEKEHKHAVVAAHLGKKWIFKEVSWGDWERNKLPEKIRILKRDRGNLTFENATQNTK